MKWLHSKWHKLKTKSLVSPWILRFFVVKCYLLFFIIDPFCTRENFNLYKQNLLFILLSKGIYFPEQATLTPSMTSSPIESVFHTPPCDKPMSSDDMIENRSSSMQVCLQRLFRFFKCNIEGGGIKQVT